jgi:signal transduction histidine kinase
MKLLFHFKSKLQAPSTAEWFPPWNTIWQKTRAILPASLGLMGVLGFLYIVSESNYLLFHAIAEIFALVVTVGIFVFAWNAREYLDNNYLLFVGIAYLFISMIDMLHMLSYTGMGVFPWADSNLPTQLWVAGRYVGSITLLLAPFTLNRKLNVSLVFSGYALVTLLLLASIFYWKNFPVCYIEGVGLTPFKKASEFVIAFILLVSIGLLWRSREAFARYVLWLLIAGIVLKIGSELEFAAYIRVQGIHNLAGHFLRIVSFYLFYLAIIETGLKKPYSILLRQLKQNQMVLEERSEELRRRNEELDAFAHSVAHDLLNPVSSALFTAKLIEGAELDREKLSDYLKGISRNMSKISRIIDELLLLAQIRQVDMIGAPIDMGQTVAAASERLKDLIESSQAEVIVPDSWPTALGHEAWIEEVWVNYISNAIKYGGSPPRIELRSDIKADGTVEFCVSDNGKGLTEEEKARLFKPFTQLNQVRLAGYGLGLSIVRRIVEKLGGEVRVESTPGLGSTFCFSLQGVRDDSLEQKQVSEISWQE